MNQNLLKTTLLASALLLGACSSMPTTTPMLDQARNDFVAANNNAQVSSYAALEFKQATEALDQANAAAARRDSLAQIDKLAYIATQKIATAREVAKQKAAEADAANAAKMRTSVQLEARTAEADRANAAAATAQGQAAAAKDEAAAAQARAATLETMMRDLQAKQTERGMVITIGDVLFATGQATLTTAGMDNLRKLATALTDNPERNVLIEGFTDSVGGASYNLALSERRASAVRNALLSMGVSSQRIAIKGYGEAFPVASNDTAGNKQLNRRVEIVLSNAGAPIAPRQ